MNFFKRGLVSVLRKRGKTVILLLLVFILGNVMAGVISIKEAVKNTQQIMREKIGVVLSIELDYEAMSQSGLKEQPKSIPVETIDLIGRLKQIKSYDYFTKIWLESTTLKSYMDPEILNGMDLAKRVDDSAPARTSFQLSGGQNPEISDRVQGKINLVDGRVFTVDEIQNSVSAVLVSKKFAELNNLSVGSTFILQREIYKYMSGSEKIAQPQVAVKKEFEFNIVGLFEPEKVVDVSSSGQIQVNNSELNNTLYTTNKAINMFSSAIMEAEKQANGSDISYSYSYLTPVFVLKDPQELDNFRAEATPLLPVNYKLTDNSSTYQFIATPMKNMDWIASVILLVAIGATLVILSLLITLFLRDRRHEMGIYLSLGESKRKVAAQILTEVMLIGFVAITLSLFSGNIVAGRLSEAMLGNQIVAEQESQTPTPGSAVFSKSAAGSGMTTQLDTLGYSSNFSRQEMIDSYSVKIGLDTIVLFYLVGLGSILVSTLVPIIYVTRLNPKKIMM
ncbi:MAG TPA: ABC transporter permease [Clostridia bacterium]